MRALDFCRPVLALFAGLLAGACSSAPSLVDESVSISPELRLAVERRADHALIADATVELDRAARIYLEYGNDRVGWLRTPTSEAATLHRLTILRLRAETAYQVRAFAVDEPAARPP